MKFQGQSLIADCEDLPNEEFYVPGTYGISNARAKEILNLILAHFKACSTEEGANLKEFVKTLPLDAQSPAELALASNFLGQFLARKGEEMNRRERLSKIMSSILQD